jgi:HEPN domain-containing protein
MVEITEKNYSNMKENLEYANGLINKAINLFLKAYEELKKDYPIYSNVISLCIDAMELAVKAIFKIIELEYPKEHQLLYDKEGKIFSVTKELLQRVSSEYPYFKDSIVRVISLTHDWHNCRTKAKYGIPELNIPPDKLFTKNDAEKALRDALECISTAWLLYSLSPIINPLKNLLSKLKIEETR